MLSDISRNWWVLALRGALAVVFGAIAFVWPGITFEALVLLFGAYALIDGVLMLSYGLVAAGDNENGWPLALGGILGIATGVLTFVRPDAMALALVYVIGAWAMLQIVAAIRLRDIIDSEWLIGLSGALSIVFGVLVLAQPGAGAQALTYLFGFYAVLAGITEVVLGFRLRGLGEAIRPSTQSVTSSPR
jgi:uncharacterized membrane protein HdeD (DUF308 family)